MQGFEPFSPATDSASTIQVKKHLGSRKENEVVADVVPFPIFLVPVVCYNPADQSLTFT